MSEQALGGIPLGFGIVVEDKPSELSCRHYVEFELHFTIWVSFTSLYIFVVMDWCLHRFSLLNTHLSCFCDRDIPCTRYRKQINSLQFVMKMEMVI